MFARYKIGDQNQFCLETADIYLHLKIYIERLEQLHLATYIHVIFTDAIPLKTFIKPSAMYLLKALGGLIA